MSTVESPERRPRRRKEQQRAQETREKIIHAAAHEFARYGFDGAATRAIAEAAGVQHTLVGYHFGSKDGLWQETLRHFSIDRHKTLTARLDGLRGVDACTKLYLYLEEFIRYSASFPDFAWIMGHVASQPNPQLDWLLETQILPGFASVAEMIVAAQKAGRFIDGEPRYLYYLFIGMVTRVFMLSAEVERVLGQSPFDESFVDMHVKSCLGIFFKRIPQLDDN